MTILLSSDPEHTPQYVQAIPGQVIVVDGWPGLTKELADRPEETLVVIGPEVPTDASIQFAEEQRLSRPALGVVLLRQRVDVKVLASALRAGVREVIAPDDVTSLTSACQRSLYLSSRTMGWQPQVEQAPEGRVITVFAAKGGCGKTTMATNVAASLAAGGRRSVCLVDLDLSFGDVGIALQLFPERSMSDAIAMQGNLDEAGMRSLITPHSPGLDVLLAPMEPGDAERIAPAVVSEVLSVLRRMYEYVVVDTPPDFKDWVLAALDVSDAHVLLATLDVPAIKNLRLALDMLDLLGYPTAMRQVVLNRSDSKVGLDISDVEKSLKVPITAQIPSSRAVSASINKGVPLVLEQPNHAISVAIRLFAEQRLTTGAVGVPASRHGAVAASDATKSPRKGLLQRRKVARA
jgi:pilus assembly protein CpaE